MEIPDVPGCLTNATVANIPCDEREYLGHDKYQVPGTVLHEVSYVGTMVLHTVGEKSSGTEYDQVGGTVRPVSCS